MKFGKDNSVFKGKFDDLNTYWYKTVGATLITSAVINIIFMPIVEGTKIIMNKIKIFLDRGCRCKKEDTKKEVTKKEDTTKEVPEDHTKKVVPKGHTKKRTQKQLEALYLGPIFLIEYRYSAVLTMMFLCLTYSSGLPCLYFVTFAYLFITYWIDKLFIFRLYRTPPNFDADIERRVRDLLQYAVFIHVIFAIWVYGNTDIFQQEILDSTASFGKQVSSLSNQDSGYVSAFFSRIQFSQNAVLVGILIFFFLIYLIKSLVSGFFMRLARLCCRRRADSYVEQKNEAEEMNYMSLIRPDQLKSERLVIEKELTEVRDKELKKMLSQRALEIEKELSSNQAQSDVHKTYFPQTFSYNIKMNRDINAIYLNAE
eukprot:TRINITY_DN6109_c0_g1_i1.p1 TRINITY_DN6109_c0_g1~~TRINITY_DN6109_c0_g1_i1.p1  ORF type:complete len:370 (+),score=67.41 TRINITY_DN6109_c0_g1_i1:385-1494(+)